MRYHPTPNPAKVALMLEEVGLAYQVVPVDTGKGEQHKPEFRAINPNGKVPAIVDTALRRNPRLPDAASAKRKAGNPRRKSPI
jgi:glutathione S-transferase